MISCWLKPRLDCPSQVNRHVRIANRNPGLGHSARSDASHAVHKSKWVDFPPPIYLSALPPSHVAYEFRILRGEEAASKVTEGTDKAKPAVKSYFGRCFAARHSHIDCSSRAHEFIQERASTQFRFAALTGTIISFLLHIQKTEVGEQG